MKKHAFFVIVLLYIIVVFYLASTTPISPHEAQMFFESDTVVTHLMRWGQGFSDTFFGLRIFFVLLGLCSIALFYLVSKYYLPKPEDVYLSSVVFMLLPGMLAGMTLANIAIVVLPIVLLFILFYEKGYFTLPVFLMTALFFLHDVSIVFFIAIWFYAIVRKDTKMVIVASAFLLAFIILSKGIEIGGHPIGHFAEIFGLYAAIFSPFLFLYFVYTMYRILLRNRKNILWYISFTALAFSLLLSVRQRIPLTDFAPYVMIAVPLMVQIYYQSVRVRLPQFQRIYIVAFYVVFTMLIFNTSVIASHRLTYYMSHENPKHFAARLYKPYEIARKLKAEGKICYEGDVKGKERYVYRYYKLPICNNY